MLFVPLQPVPSQLLRATLNAQVCRFRVYQRSTGMFIDVYVNEVLVIGGVICLDRNLIVRSTYLGFVGDLAFVDLVALPDSGIIPQDPTYDLLGSRYQLVYLYPSELP